MNTALNDQTNCWKGLNKSIAYFCVFISKLEIGLILLLIKRKKLVFAHFS